MRINFEPVSTSRRKSGKCPVCGKTVVRQQKFEHTINPFNKNTDGTIKTYSQVLNAVEKEADEWKPDFRHDKCK
jgi:hypothetical protein